MCGLETGKEKRTTVSSQGALGVTFLLTELRDSGDSPELFPLLCSQTLPSIDTAQKWKRALMCWILAKYPEIQAH